MVPHPHLHVRSTRMGSGPVKQPGDMKEGTGTDKGLNTAADVTSPEDHAITTDNEDAPAGRTTHQPAQRPNSNKVPVVKQPEASGIPVHRNERYGEPKHRYLPQRGSEGYKG